MKNSENQNSCIKTPENQYPNRLCVHIVDIFPDIDSGGKPKNKTVKSFGF